jgi:hypothetical protein
MNIKIKNIKKIVLTLACIFLAGMNYFSLVKADNTTISCDKTIDSDCDGLTNTEEKLYGTNENNADTDNDGYSDGVEVKSGYNPTIPAPADRVTKKASNTETTSIEPASTATIDNFSQSLNTFISSRNGKSVTNSDINEFVESNLSNKVGEPITLASLPEIDISSINILKQQYASLSDDLRKKQLTADAEKYYTELFYLALSNSPKMINTRSDAEAFGQEFLDRYATFSTATPDYAYFKDLGNRLDTLLIQINDMQVPETIVPMHIKMIRIINGYLSLRNSNVSESDPLSKMALISKIQALNSITESFFANDVDNYLSQFNK